MGGLVGVQRAPAVIEYWRFVPTPEVSDGLLVFKRLVDHRETTKDVMSTKQIHDKIVSPWLQHHYGFCKIYNNGCVKTYCNHKRMIKEMGEMSCPVCIK